MWKQGGIVCEEGCGEHVGGNWPLFVRIPLSPRLCACVCNQPARLIVVTNCCAVNLIIFRFGETRQSRVVKEVVVSLEEIGLCLCGTLCFRQSCVCNRPALKAIEGH